MCSDIEKALDELRNYARSTSDNIPYHHFDKIDKLVEIIRNKLSKLESGEYVLVQSVYPPEEGQLHIGSIEWCAQKALEMAENTEPEEEKAYDALFKFYQRLTDSLEAAKHKAMIAAQEGRG